MNQEVSYAVSSNILNELGEVGYIISQIVLITRSLDITTSLNVTHYFTVEDIDAKIEEAIALQQSLLSNHDSWKFCSYSSIVNEKKIPYWHNYDGVHLEYGSLYSILGLFIQNVIKN